ncbi:sodium:solute symporter family transporter [Lacipirellula sp.]|uniref:sodium:solute symporter family transporter n=1 Tax=Lacipirellula sp. TaxID=2691419 RepID=UPI003D0F8F2A
MPNLTQAPVRWEQLAPLPDAVGFAGSVAGLDRGTLLVAGGANFPQGRPWDGATKTWHDRVFVLRPNAKEWEELADRLPRPLGYAVSATTPYGIAVVGGNHADGVYRDAFLLRVDDDRLTTEQLPPLPLPLVNAAGAMIGATLYIAGGQSAADANKVESCFLSIDLSQPADKRVWVELDTWPGAPRMLATAGVQEGAFYLFGGVELADDAAGTIQRRYLKDGYRYQPQQGWRQVADMPRPVAAAPTPAPAVGTSHLLIVGGDDGENAARVAELKDAHPGFSRASLAYHTVTDRWILADKLPFSLATTPTIRDGASVIIPGGETRPGVRTNEVWRGTLTPQRAEFGLLNLSVLGVYPLIMLGIGVWCSRRSKDAEGFFRGGQQIPWWAAGLSIYATMLSSITFMAIPAKAFFSNWWFIFSQISVIVLAPVIIAVYLPFFRQLNLTSAYEYLEHRFNLAVRWFGSASFIAFQIARTGIVLYLPALALSTVSSIDTTTCIAGMTLLTIVVTYFGGMEAVIWTDVAQSIILLAAAALSLAVIAWQLDGSTIDLFRTAANEGKFFPAIPVSPDFAIESVWVLVLGTFFATLISYTSNQEVVQRFMTTSDEKQAARAIWVNAWLSLPSGMLFFAVGTALYLFYQQFPERLDPGLARNDAIYPFFMVHELPPGLAGFVVAGIFAAAQPTSSLNSVATAVVTDFYQRLRPEASPKSRVRVGRASTIITGLAGMAVALTMEQFPVESLWELFLNVLGLTTGILAGLFSLGILTKRAHGTGALLGVAACIAAMWAVSEYGDVHAMMYGCLAVVVSFGAGYLFSLLLPGATKQLEGLTIHTQRSLSSSPAPTSLAALAAHS